MMQQDPTAAPTIDSQQQQHQEQLMMMPLPPKLGFGPSHHNPNPNPNPNLYLRLWCSNPRNNRALPGRSGPCGSTTGHSKGYGFLEFVSQAATQMALQNYNGIQMPRDEHFYRLNWATDSSTKKRSEDFTIFMGDLASGDRDELLQETFKAVY
eukprot:PITA_08123